MPEMQPDIQPALTREQALVESIKQWTGERLIGDDCAVLPGGTLVTTDTLVEGTHFLPSIKFADLGWKSVAVNLSDIAAMAGRPRYITTSLTLPPDIRPEKVEELYRGMVECARTYRTRIVGGDLTQGAVISVSITALGDVHEKGCILRSTAQPGDIVAVTGDFGAAGAGLAALQAGSLSEFPHLTRAHFHPLPRLCESWALVRAAGPRAALMDASDGLADALFQIGRESGVGMDIDFSKVPVHAQTRQAAERFATPIEDFVLYGGEDYELVAAIDPQAWKTLSQSTYNPFVAIGAVSSSRKIRLQGHSKLQLLDASKMYQHFRS